MTQKRRSGRKEENKEKYCCFWYEWQLVEEIRGKFELWLDVAARGDPFASGRSPVNLFPTTLLNAKQMQVLRFLTFFQHDSISFLFWFIADDCEYINKAEYGEYFGFRLCFSGSCNAGADQKYSNVDSSKRYALRLHCHNFDLWNSSALENHHIRADLGLLVRRLIIRMLIEIKTAFSETRKSRSSASFRRLCTRQ